MDGAGTFFVRGQNTKVTDAALVRSTMKNGPHGTKYASRLIVDLSTAPAIVFKAYFILGLGGTGSNK